MSAVECDPLMLLTVIMRPASHRLRQTVLPVLGTSKMSRIMRTRSFDEGHETPATVTVAIWSPLANVHAMFSCIFDQRAVLNYLRGSSTFPGRYTSQ